jgi:hypothetical protein
VLREQVLSADADPEEAYRSLLAHRREASAVTGRFITITGANTEDTMITTERGPELVTCTGRWPRKPIEVEGLTLELPQVLLK